MDLALTLYDRISDFALRNRIQKDDFLKDNPMYVTKKELKERFENINFDIKDEELTAIMAHHNADKTDYLLIEEFVEKLSCWRSSEEFNKVLDQHIDININHLRDQSKKDIPTTKKGSKASKKAQIKPTKLKKSVPMASESSKVSEPVQKHFPNKSKKYLKMAKKKQIDEEGALALNIEKCKKELEVD